MLAHASPNKTLGGSNTFDTYLGPWCRGLGQFYIIVTTVMAFGAVDIKPMFHTLILGAAFGCLLLAPRQAVLDMRVSLVSVCLLMVLAMSVLWTFDDFYTTFLIRLELPRSFFLMLVVAVLPQKDTIGGLKKAMWFILTMTIAALILDPSTRAHGIIAGSTEPYPGWHGLFLHKNSMSPYLVFALITHLVWEKRTAPRVLGFLVIIGLMVGSQSGTGLAASMFVCSFYMWLTLYRRSENRWSGGFLVASTAVGICGTVSAFAAVSQISAAAGKGTSFSGRTFIWEAVGRAVIERPLFGYGYGGLFQRPASPMTREIWRGIGFDAPHAHNGVLDLLVQVGVVGTVIFGALFFSTLFGGLAVRATNPGLTDWIILVLSVQVVVGLSEPVFLGAWVPVVLILRGLTLKSLPSGRQRHTRVALAFRGSHGTDGSDGSPGEPDVAADRDDPAKLVSN